MYRFGGAEVTSGASKCVGTAPDVEVGVSIVGLDEDERARSVTQQLACLYPSDQLIQVEVRRRILGAGDQDYSCTDEAVAQGGLDAAEIDDHRGPHVDQRLDRRARIRACDSHENVLPELCRLFRHEMNCLLDASTEGQRREHHDDHIADPPVTSARAACEGR